MVRRKIIEPIQDEYPDQMKLDMRIIIFLRYTGLLSMVNGL